MTTIKDLQRRYERDLEYAIELAQRELDQLRKHNEKRPDEPFEPNFTVPGYMNDVVKSALRLETAIEVSNDGK